LCFAAVVVAAGCALKLEAGRVGRGRLQLCIRLGWQLCTAAALTGGVQAVVWPRGSNYDSLKVAKCLVRFLLSLSTI
uniref:G_PROTEIN_RECEP_F3_4 domain-containing protein n=1 Tax=Rodentolepis nana TaxID=102285 RepID=A0A0R3TDA7_RODNA